MVPESPLPIRVPLILFTVTPQINQAMKFLCDSPTSFPPFSAIFGGLALLAGIQLQAAPYEHHTYLKAPSSAAEDSFGGAIAIDGDLVVVGAAGEDSAASGVNGGSEGKIDNSGAAYVYQRTGSEWRLLAYLKSPSPTTGANFGSSVSVSGTVIAVGEPREAGGGQVHLFRLVSGQILQEATVKGWNTESSDGFGLAISVSGRLLAVGAPNEDGDATGANGSGVNNSKFSAGAAYVFRNDGSVWPQEAYLKASNTDSGDLFGLSVSVAGDTVVVGAPYEDGSSRGVNGVNDNSRSDSGAAYVFTRPAGQWLQEAYVKSSNADAGDSFACSVSIDGEILLIGATGEDGASEGVHGNKTDNSKSGAGAAYIFERASTAWSEEAYLKPSRSQGGTAMGGNFGSCVAVEGATALVGAAGGKGACPFQRNPETWMSRPVLETPQIAFPVSFGVSVAVSGDSLMVGDTGDSSGSDVINSGLSDSSASRAGAAYVFIPPALKVTAVKGIPASLSPLLPGGSASRHFMLDWQPRPGNRHDVLRSVDLRSWNSFPGFPTAVYAPREIFGLVPKEFYKVVDIDAAPPDGILEMYPAAGAFAVPRFEDLEIILKNSEKIIPQSLQLMLGTAGPFTLADSPRMTFTNGVLRYNVTDTALGDFDADVDASLVVGDADGYITTYRWKFSLEKSPIVEEDLFVFGSAGAQGMGQNLDAAQREVAASTVGTVRLSRAAGIDDWALSGVVAGSLAISYTGVAPSIFHAGQYLVNDAPADKGQVFCRRVISVSDDAATKVLTLMTVDVPLTAIVKRGSCSFGEKSQFFDPSPIGTLHRTRTRGATSQISGHEENLSGTTLAGNASLSIYFEELGYFVTPEIFFAFDIEDWELLSFAASASVTLDVSVIPRADFHGGVSSSGEAELVGRKTLKVIRLGTIGPFPVWLDVDFSMKAKWGGSVVADGSIRGGFRKKWEVRTGVIYNAVTVDPPHFSPPKLIVGETELVGPEVTTEASASAWLEVEPRFDFLLESLVGAYLSVNPRMENSATIRRTNGAITSKGFSGKVGADLKFGFSVEGTDIDQDWPKIGEIPLFTVPWCREWTPATGWKSCPNVPDDDDDDTG